VVEGHVKRKRKGDEVTELKADPGPEEQLAPLSARVRRTDTADAFIPDPQEGGQSRTSDDLAENLAEDFVRSATTGEDAEDETAEQVVPEEYGGPFVETTADEEFGMDEDESNPPGAMAEPLPRAIHGLTERPPRG
jgi:hypothetical protein